MKNYFINLWHSAALQNNAILGNFMEYNPRAKVLDLGCDNGILVKSRVAKYIKSKNIWGVDIDRTILTRAKRLGLKTYFLDLNMAKFPFKKDFFDVIQLNQVIEHLWDTDTIMEEIYRIIKPDGYLIISTENLSSWHNLFSLIFGYQAPSQDISNKYRVANPFSLCQIRPRTTTSHQRIFTLRGLVKFCRAHGFKVEKKAAAGYYPFPSFLAKILCGFDPYHGAFICIKARKTNYKRKIATS